MEMTEMEKLDRVKLLLFFENFGCCDLAAQDFQSEKKKNKEEKEIIKKAASCKQDCLRFFCYSLFFQLISAFFFLLLSF
jgi:hypothetical protein